MLPTTIVFRKMLDVFPITMPYRTPPATYKSKWSVWQTTHVENVKAVKGDKLGLIFWRRPLDARSWPILAPSLLYKISVCYSWIRHGSSWFYQALLYQSCTRLGPSFSCQLSVLQAGQTWTDFYLSSSG